MERFERVLREALASSGVREPAGNGAKPDLMSIAHMRGGLREIDRAALSLQLTSDGDLPELMDRSAGSVFRAAGRRGLIREAAAERLAEAATLWRNLDGSMQLVVEDRNTLDDATPKAKVVIAEAAGLEDFGELASAIRDTAEIDVLAERQPTGAV